MNRIKDSVKSSPPPLPGQNGPEPSSVGKYKPFFVSFAIVSAFFMVIAIVGGAGGSGGSEDIFFSFIASAFFGAVAGVIVQLAVWGGRFIRWMFSAAEGETATIRPIEAPKPQAIPESEAPSQRFQDGKINPKLLCKHCGERGHVRAWRAPGDRVKLFKLDAPKITFHCDNCGIEWNNRSD